MIATYFLRSKPDWGKFAEEFRIVLGIDEPEFPEIYQLVQTLEGSPGAKNRMEKAQCEEPESNLRTCDGVKEENVFLSPFRV